MKAIAKAYAGPGLDLIDAPDPVLAPGHVLVRLQAGSICGTDRHIDEWDSWAANRIKPPRIIGHEFAGVIEALGEGVTDREIGQLVASESHIVDEDSAYLARGEGHVAPETTILGVDVDGGFRSHVVIPAANARPVPAGLPAEYACMLDAVGNGVHTALDGPVEGQTILITGLGPIGLFAAAVCRAMGAAKIVATEISDFRSDLGRQLGVDTVIDPRAADSYDRCKALAPGGFDGVLEMSGHPGALDLGIESVRPGGRISLLGVYADRIRFMDMNQIVFKGIRVQGIVGRRLWETWDQMTDLIENRGLDYRAVVTHQLPWGDFREAFDLLGSGEAGKVVLRF